MGGKSFDQELHIINLLVPDQHLQTNESYINIFCFFHLSGDVQPSVRRTGQEMNLKKRTSLAAHQPPGP